MRVVGVPVTLSSKHWGSIRSHLPVCIVVTLNSHSNGLYILCWAGKTVHMYTYVLCVYYVCMYVCICVCCMYVCMDVCVCMYVCMYVLCMCVHTHYIHTYVCMCCVWLCSQVVKALECQSKDHRFKSHQLPPEKKKTSFFLDLAPSNPGLSKIVSWWPGLGWGRTRPHSTEVQVGLRVLTHHSRGA